VRSLDHIHIYAAEPETSARFYTHPFEAKVIPAACELGLCKECLCPPVYAPVCGVDGQTCDNPDLAYSLGRPRLARYAHGNLRG